MREALRASYVLPLCWERETAGEREGLTAYLSWLAPLIEVLVVDASPAEVFAVHARLWAEQVRHLRPDSVHDCSNGKVAGVLTGLRAAHHDRVVIADDDVRYDDRSLVEVLRRLDGCAVVRPQNYFDPLPWHALVDTSRSLLNRACGGDWPGTLAVHRGALAGGYRGDVLFENLELVRTVRAGGGREAVARDIMVRRLPPRTTRFLSQRVRQAYDELARPWRLVAALCVLPLTIELAHRRRWRALVGAAAAVCGVAEGGRRRDGGQRVFPATASLLAPVWVLERGIASWLALVARARGGMPYRGRRIRAAASSMPELRRRARSAGPLPAA
ncbi:MAG: glycosyltransferase family 2 protein [Candidatus Dormibacteria bacterium]